MSRFLVSACQIRMNIATRSWPHKAKVAVSVKQIGKITGNRGLHVSSATRGSVGEGYHKPSDFDKKILVWTKKYKSVDDVPPQVTNIQMKKAKDVFRIRVNLMMMAATVVLAGVYAWSGRRAAKQGDSIVRQNRLWHAEGQVAKK